jgi:hypothetical protein
VRVPQLGLLALVLCTTSATAEPLGEAEVRFGYGLALAKRGEMSTRKASPLTITATASVRTSYEPPLAVWGGLLIETIDRTSVGGVAGIRLQPEGAAWRLAAGGVAIVAPATLYGPTVSGGACMRSSKSTRLCLDAQLTAYLGGDDLADQQVVTHVQLAGSVVVDAF